jgi:hypothetical protein
VLSALGPRRAATVHLAPVNFPQNSNRSGPRCERCPVLQRHVLPGDVTHSCAGASRVWLSAYIIPQLCNALQRRLLIYLALNLLAGVLVGLLPAVLLCVLAGRWDLWNAWVTAGIFVAWAAFQALALHQKSPDLMKVRWKTAVGGRVRLAVGLAFPVANLLAWIVAGLDQRFHWSNIVPPAGVVASIVLCTIGGELFTWSLLAIPRPDLLDQAPVHKVANDCLNAVPQPSDGTGSVNALAECILSQCEVLSHQVHEVVELPGYGSGRSRGPYQRLRSLALVEVGTEGHPTVWPGDTEGARLDDPASATSAA